MAKTIQTTATLQFDRGTILCDGLDEGFVPPEDCPLTWDPRVRRFRAKAAAHEWVCEALRRAGVGVRDRVREPIRRAGFREVPLRAYQRAAPTAWQLGAHRGTIVLPTGAGKTRVAIAALAERAAPAIVLVPTRVLMHQWRDCLQPFCLDAVGVLGDGQREVRPVTVVTFESARRWMHTFGNRFEVLVVDEAHHFGTGARDEVLEMCTAPCRLGLTATPPDGEARRALAELIGPVRFELSVADLRGEFLADFEVIELSLDLSAEERRGYDAARAEFLAVWQRFRDLAPSSSWRDFVRTCQQSTVGRDALRGWHTARKIASWTETKKEALGTLLARHRESKSLVFTLDKDATYAIARTQWIMPITSDISRAEREWALTAFRAGELRALVSARVLNEGVDVPDADVGIVVGGSQGTREYVQRVGRLLRPRPGKRAIVYELVSADTTEVWQAWRRRDVLGSSEPRSLRNS